jgi:hypothetical protein
MVKRLLFAAALGALTVSGASATEFERLVRAGYYSSACQAKAEALGLPRTSDPDVLFVGFSHVQSRPPAGANGSADGDCGNAVVLQINVFRLNGIEADFALAIASSGQIERMVARVPSTGRHFDPFAPVADQARRDSAFRGYTSRVYLNAARLEVVGPGSSAPQSVERAKPVKTEPVRP